MARSLGLLPFQFTDRYARKVDGRWSLIEVEKDGDHDCVFLERGDDGRAGCSIYDARPTQCRTWPFWPENLRSRSAWRQAAKDCPGIDAPDGEHVPVEEIDRRRDETPR